MTNVTRMSAHKIGTLDAPAQSAWELLTDWALRWIPKGSYDLVRVELEGGFNEVPRTRAMWTSDGRLLREKLLHQDDRARRIYYILDNDAIPGVHNYLTTITVEELKPDKCQMEFSSNFDVIDPAVDAEQCKLFVESAYDDFFLKGFANYFGANR